VKRKPPCDRYKPIVGFWIVLDQTDKMPPDHWTSSLSPSSNKSDALWSGSCRKQRSDIERRETKTTVRPVQTRRRILDPFSFEPIKHTESLDYLFRHHRLTKSDAL
jgi:hypothetical protein